MHIKITKGLDLPVEGEAKGPLQQLNAPMRIGAQFDNPDGHLKLLVKEGDRVEIGSPLVEHKVYTGLVFVSPGGGRIAEIRRGERRSVQAIAIELDETERFAQLALPNLQSSTKEEVIESFKRCGIFAHLRRRPFDQMANPAVLPRSIFVKAVESAPLMPAAERQIDGREDAFGLGLQYLAKIAPVHLIVQGGSDVSALERVEGVTVHTVEGPHPRANASVHIQAIDPIQRAEDAVWTIDVWGVLAIGAIALKGQVAVDRVVAIAGGGIEQQQRRYVRARLGAQLGDLLRATGANPTHSRLISGDPLTGVHCRPEDFLRVSQAALIALPEAGDERQLLSFMRLGRDKFTATRTYLSRWLPKWLRGRFAFSTHQHGEERAFIDPRPYDRVMPLNLCVVELVKACQLGDFGRADHLGLLQVAAEDFALATFVCPSKIEISHIIEQALARRAKDE